MSGMDGENDSILILAATKAPWTLDSDVRMCFQTALSTSYPGEESRRNILHHHVGTLKTTLTQGHYHTLARTTRGYSGDDIKRLVREAAMMPIRRFHAATHFKLPRDGSGYAWLTTNDVSCNTLFLHAIVVSLIRDTVFTLTETSRSEDEMVSHFFWQLACDQIDRPRCRLCYKRRAIEVTVWVNYCRVWLIAHSHHPWILACRMNNCTWLYNIH